MAAQDKTAMLARLDIWLDDADNFAFTSPQKAEGYNTVVNNDPLVYKVVTDQTLTTIASQATYTPATTYDTIVEIKIDINGDSYPLPVARSGWEYTNGVILFHQEYKNLLAGKTIWLVAKQKLDADTDMIPTNLQSYVLHRTVANMLAILSSRKTGRFLRNDTTMGEILQNQAYHENQANLLGKKLSNRRDIVL